MGNGRRKYIERHLRAELDARRNDADDPEMVLQFGFIKNPYRGDTIPIAASSIEAFCPVVRDVFDRFTVKKSFAADWIERSTNIQKLS